jgi:hypothetical protein
MTKPLVPKPQPQPKLTREAAMTERALADDAAMSAANAKPFDLGLLAPEDWMHKGGNCGFKLNGFSIVRRR